MSSKSVKSEGCPTRVSPQCVTSGCPTSGFAGKCYKYCFCSSTYVSAFGFVGFILFEHGKYWETIWNNRLSEGLFRGDQLDQRRMEFWRLPRRWDPSQRPTGVTMISQRCIVDVAQKQVNLACKSIFNQPWPISQASEVLCTSDWMTHIQAYSSGWNFVRRSRCDHLPKKRRLHWL